MRTAKLGVPGRDGLFFLLPALFLILLPKYSPVRWLPSAVWVGTLLSCRVPMVSQTAHFREFNAENWFCHHSTHYPKHFRQPGYSPNAWLFTKMHVNILISKQEQAPWAAQSECWAWKEGPTRTMSRRKSHFRAPRSYRPTPPSRKQHRAWPGGSAKAWPRVRAGGGASLVEDV